MNTALLKADSPSHSSHSMRSSMQNWYYDVKESPKLGGKGVHTMFLDFRQAFDLVDHKILLTKLAEINIS